VGAGLCLGAAYLGRDGDMKLVHTVGD
jgi:hypothetical protein